MDVSCRFHTLIFAIVGHSRIVQISKVVAKKASSKSFIKTNCIIVADFSLKEETSQVDNENWINLLMSPGGLPLQSVKIGNNASQSDGVKLSVEWDHEISLILSTCSGLPRSANHAALNHHSAQQIYDVCRSAERALPRKLR